MRINKKCFFMPAAGPLCTTVKDAALVYGKPSDFKLFVYLIAGLQKY